MSMIPNDLICKGGGAMYAGVIPDTLLPARTDDGDLMAIQHPRDGQWGVPVLTATGRIAHYAAGAIRSLPPRIVTQVRLSQIVRLETWDNSSDDRELMAVRDRWAGH